MNQKPDMPLNANKRPAFGVFTKWDECLRKAKKDGEHVVKSVDFTTCSPLASLNLFQKLDLREKECESKRSRGCFRSQHAFNTCNISRFMIGM